MCIILFQWQPESATPLVLAANRDEFHARPTEAATWRDNVFCGQDKLAGGTWLGMTPEGRFAAVTNFREPIQDKTSGQRSRGELPWCYLQGELPPADYVQLVAQQQQEYGPFNLLVGNRQQLWYLGNRGEGPVEVAAGIHGLSNGLLDTPWPKVQRGKQSLELAIEAGSQEADLLAFLTDRQQPAEHELPETGVGKSLEQLVAPIFVQSPTYGTRCSSLLWLPANNAPLMVEHRWQPNGQPAGISRSQKISSN